MGRLRRVWRIWKKRRPAKPRAAGVTRRGPDSGSVFLVALLLVGTALVSNLAHPLPKKAGAGQMRFDAAQHVFAAQEQPPKSVRAPVHACIGSITPLRRTQACSHVEKNAWLWAAANDLRRAMGEKPCWWYADIDDLAAISGVTEVWAARALEARGHTRAARLPGELEAVIGAHRTRLIDEAVSINCAMQTRPTQ